jgi:large repetitive protein
MNNSRLAFTAKSGGALHQKLYSRINRARYRLSSHIGAAAFLTCLTTPASALDIAWNANPESNVSGYKLKYGTTSGVYPNVVSIGTTPAASVSGLNEGSTYYFVVTAVNELGLESTPSAVISHFVEPTSGNPNQPPVATPATLALAEDSSAGITLGGTDANSDHLTFSIVSGPSHGSLTGTPPAMSYTPTANYHGNDSFTFRVHDGSVHSAAATVSISISPVNDLPTAAAKSVTTTEDTPISILLSGSDVENSGLAFSIVTGPTRGALTGTPPNLTYTPAANLNGSDSFTFQVHDGSAFSSPATVSISVSSINDLPIAAAKSISTTEGTAVPITLSATDVETSALTYSVATQPANGTLTGTPPNLIYLPTSGFSGSDSFTYRAHDGTASSTSATVNISIAKRPPFPGTTVLSRSGWTLKYVDSQETFDSPGTFAFDGNPATFWHTQWRNGANLPPPHEIQINLGSVQNLCGFQYLPRQDQPIVGNIAEYEFYVSTDGVNWGTPAATGVFTASKNEKQVLFSAKSGQFIRLKALSEIGGNFDTCVAELNLLQGTVTNQPPLAAAQSLSTEEDTPLAITLDGGDPEGNPLTFSIVTHPSHGTLTGTPPNLTYLPGAGYSGSDQFSFRSNDGAVFSPAATVTLSITPVTDVPGNIAPTFSGNPLSASASEDSPFSGQLAATDANPGDILSFRKISGPSWLTVSMDGALGGTPLNGDVGTNSFTVKVSDPSNASATATLTVTVENVNDAPIFKITPLVYPAGTEKMLYRDQTLASIAIDPDAGDRIHFSKVSGPDWLTVSRSGALSGTPPAGSGGLNQFTVSVIDETGASTSSSLQIRINSNTLPLPWNLDRVGTGNLAGAARYSAGTFTVAGAGALAEKQDAGNFGWQTLTGNGQIVARIHQLGDTGPATRVGLMIRESLASNSRQIFIGLNGDGNFHLLHRARTGGKTSKITRKNSKSHHVWLRLAREEDTVIAYRSFNGKSWDRIGKAQVNLPRNCYIGLSVSSGSKDLLNTSKFSNVRVSR